MDISRRQWLAYCASSAAVLGLPPLVVRRLSEVLAPAAVAPTVVWLQGSGCSGCSLSLLNRIAEASPRTADELVNGQIDLAYHPLLMTLAGESAAGRAEQAAREGGHILVVEGAIPTAFEGRAGIAWTTGGREVTLLEACRSLAATAKHIVCVGTCSSFGGLSAAAPNPTAARSVAQVTGKPTLNLAGCPPHPDWIVYALSQLLAGVPQQLDQNGCPSEIYGRSLHRDCPLHRAGEANALGEPGLCYERVGCRGEGVMAPCVYTRWNGGTNWCIGANAACIACASPTFPAVSAGRGGRGGGRRGPGGPGFGRGGGD